MFFDYQVTMLGVDGLISFPIFAPPTLPVAKPGERIFVVGSALPTLQIGGAVIESFNPTGAIFNPGT